MARLLLVLACLAVALVAVSAELKLSQVEMQEHLEWLQSTVMKLDRDPTIKNDPVQREEMIAQLQQVAFKWEINMPSSNSSLGDGDDICFRDIQPKIGLKPKVCLNETYPSIDKDGRCYPTCRTNFEGHGHLCRERCRVGWSYHALTDTCVEIGVVGPNTTGCPWFDSCGHLAAHGCAHCPASHPKADWLLCECHLNHTQNRYKPAAYDRSHGVQANCELPRFFHDGLCYFNCTKDYVTIGGLCVEKCPATYQSIALICCKTFGTCVDQLKKLATDGLQIMDAIIAMCGGSIDPQKIGDLIKSIVQTVVDVLIPDCKGLPPPNSTLSYPF